MGIVEKFEKFFGQGEEKEDITDEETGAVPTSSDLGDKRARREDDPNWFREQR